MFMKMIGIAQFKARLSEYLDLDRTGEDVVVTDRGRPVATVSRVSGHDSEIDDLVRAGVVTPARGKLTEDFFEMERPEITGGSLLDAVLEEREEGY